MSERARQLAIKWHKDQKYGEHDYVYHLDKVVSVIEQYYNDIDILYRTEFTLELAIIIGYLHDILEDTDIPWEELYGYIGEIIRPIEAVTDAKGKNRKERKRLTWHKIRKFAVAIFVKLADRIANMREAVQTKNTSKIQMYKKEFEAFESALYVPGMVDSMWNELRLLHETS